jgi:DNA-binding transcriptional MerR regulator
MNKTNLKQLDEAKLYYSISEVCTLTGLEQHVLRYWESEFPQLKPKKNRAGNRAYRVKDIKLVRYIKFLLYEEMFAIPGAKKKLSDLKPADLDGQINLLRAPLVINDAPKQKIKKKGIVEVTIEIPDSAGSEPLEKVYAAHQEQNKMQLVQLCDELKAVLQILDRA